MSMASILIPGNSFALKDYGYALNGAQRWAEALRYADRATRRAPWMLEAHLLFIAHGRRTCLARRPRCGDCPLLDLCPYGRSVTAAG